MAKNTNKSCQAVSRVVNGEALARIPGRHAAGHTRPRQGDHLLAKTEPQVRLCGLALLFLLLPSGFLSGQTEPPQVEAILK